MSKSDGFRERDPLGRFVRRKVTARDDFALEALKAILLHSYGDGVLSSWSAEEIALEAYVIADAMLEARAN